MNSTNKLDRYILPGAIINAGFFLLIYATHLFELDNNLIRFLHELFMIPMILAAPLIAILSILQIKKHGYRASNISSLLLSVTITIIIVVLFIKDS